MSRPFQPRLAVCMGDPGGIGREVIASCLKDAALRTRARWVLLGPWSDADGLANLPQVEVLDRSPVTGWAYGGGRRAWTAGPTIDGGEASFQAVCDACELARRPAGDPSRVDGIVTGPISKEAWALAGHGEFPGHTELLAARLGARDGEFGMFFHAPGKAPLNVMLATIHVPLARVPGLLTIGRVVSAIRLGHRACLDLGIASPRVAVCGVNPHAGEHGLLGREEIEVIAPAVEAARELGIDASGPHPGDTVFNATVQGRYDLVVAMYHDQGLIPVKLLAFDRAVNVTVGLCVPRTSPDHGTAFDIAGRGVADPGSMRAALELAVVMASRKEGV